MLHRLWKDDAGFVVSTELVLVATILVIGMVVGLATVRNAVVQELADVATAIGSINQSYTYTGVEGRINEDTDEPTSATAGSSFTDQLDFCDQDGDVPDLGAAGITVLADPTDEGVAL
ncbi:MAG: hypothetical protein RBS80_16895 [Thermoguttaceae bacterium]|jgi:Flp pilus assembly pilin Flp|nr:hypothetical protein [Thermoguttaceae bacterium]